MTEYASLSKYLSKNVQVVTQIVNNRKVMAKTPREANLCGNWCVRKGSSRKFAHRGQTKELSYGREGVRTRFVVRSTVKKKEKKEHDRRPIMLRRLQLKEISNKLSQAWTSPSKKGRRFMHACSCKRSTADIDSPPGFWRPGWRRWQELAPVRRTLEIYTGRPLLSVQKKLKSRVFLRGLCMSPCSFRNGHWSFREAPLRTWDRRHCLGRLGGRTRIMCIAICHTFLPLSITLSFEEGGRG